MVCKGKKKRYTPETLAKTFESVGFRAVKSQELNVWDVACTGLK